MEKHFLKSDNVVRSFQNTDLSLCQKERICNINSGNDLQNIKHIQSLFFCRTESEERCRQNETVTRA
jgi:hypothetical protein